jgi:hypothetical protein
VSAGRFLLTFLLFIAPFVAGAADLFPRWGSSFWRDSIPESVRQSYISFGQQYAGKSWQSLPVSVFSEYKQNGNRTRYESLQFEKRRQLAALVMAELMEGKRRLMPDIINGLMSTLEETWWGLPAHYRTAVPQADDQNVDLFNAETASLIAYTRYVLEEEIRRFSPLMLELIDKEMARRLLEPAVKTNYSWKTAGMNWNPWICSNWLACVLFCEHDASRRAEALRQINKACDAFMNAYPADGGCDEGIHYWDRAAASLFETYYLMSKMSELDFATMDKNRRAKLQAMGAYIYKMYIGNDYAVNFADAHGNKAMLHINIAYPFGLVIGDKTMCQYAAWVGQKEDFMHNAGQLYNRSGNWPPLARELIFLQYIQQFMREQPREPHVQNVWLPDLQVMTSREPYVAFKGGNNGESHNHNDVGSFIVYTDGTPLLIDTGVGAYDAKTFSNKRYEVWTMQSDYHNLPRINGYSQHDGKQYKARVVSYKPGEMTLDISGAYPKESHVRWWNRTVKTGGHRVEVTEDYSLYDYDAPSQLMLMTLTQPNADKPGQIALGTHSITYDARQLSVAVEDVSDKLDFVLRGMWGNKMYRIVMTVRQKKLKDKIKYYIQ